MLAIHKLKYIITLTLIPLLFSCNQVQKAEQGGATVEELTALLGRARARKGMFEGDLEEGELEIGQVSALLNNILPAGVIVSNVWKEFLTALSNPVKKF